MQNAIFAAAMRNFFKGWWLPILVFGACTNGYPEAQDGLDCGRQFIGAIFNGNFKRARQLTLPDETNLKILENKLEKDFSNRSSLDKERLSQASIVINEVSPVNDSVVIINFLNSYDSLPTILKVVKWQGQWLTDLKYTYNGNF